MSVLPDSVGSVSSKEISSSTKVRHDWTIDELVEIYSQSIPQLLHQAHTIHRLSFDPEVVQRSTLLSIKTGGCSENCAYCPQSAHHAASVDRHKLLAKDVVLAKAQEAKDNGSTRFCMGAAWREVRDNKEFEAVLDIVGGVHELGLEVCCTLGMLTPSQAEKLKAAGCYAYNHNLDTSPEFYGEIISTRTYQDRLDTLAAVRKAGMTVCSGGIIGMGESLKDRMGLLQQLSNQDPHPESVPINLLVRVEGTPLDSQADLDPLEFVRMVATARIALPKSMVRLSAGRKQMSDELQTLCFFAGANSIFAGDKLLTTENPDVDCDVALFKKLGMRFSESADHSHCQ